MMHTLTANEVGTVSGGLLAPPFCSASAMLGAGAGGAFVGAIGGAFSAGPLGALGGAVLGFAGGAFGAAVTCALGASGGVVGDNGVQCTGTPQ